VTGIIATSEGQYRVLYALLAGTGLRIGGPSIFTVIAHPLPSPTV
jgi:hypothetical protein